MVDGAYDHQLHDRYMVRIFQPTFLGCPLCIKDLNRHSLYRTSAHEKLAENQYKGHSCGHEFSLFESLLKGCHGLPGILNTFSHWNWHSEKSVVVGQLFKVPVPIPADVGLFAAFLTPYTPSDGPQFNYVPGVLDMSGSELLISTVGCLGAAPEELGNEMPLFVDVYGFQRPESRGWVRLLYESLTDYSKKNHGIAIFKLATSLELACAKTIEVYLNKKGIPPSLLQRLLKNGRNNWRNCLDPVRAIASDYLDKVELEAFENSAKASEKTIRSYRNAFAHDDPCTADHKSATEAFITSFPLFWGIDRMLSSASEP